MHQQTCQYDRLKIPKVIQRRQIMEHHKQSSTRATRIETGCKRRGNWLGRGNESTKLCCQHPRGQQGALSELTWTAESPPFFLPPLLPSISPFVFLSHPYGRFHLFPSPCPATHSIEMASLPHTNPRLLAQASHIP